MILITSASYVNPELQAEFGKIPPSFLPLGSKRLFEQQVRLFNKKHEEVVLSLPEGYSLDSGDEKKLLELGVRVVYVKDSFNLGQSIVYVMNMLLPIEGSLSILHGDTLFLDLEYKADQSSFEISKVDTSYNWEYLVDNNQTFIESDKYSIEELENYVISGFFNFSHPYELIKSITSNDYSFINGLRSYSNTHNTELVKNNTWLDFGLSATYFHSRKSFTTERTFNSLKISNGYVTKCSEKVGKLEGEINWYQNVPNKLVLFVPRFEVVEDGKCYKTEYLYLSTLSELYVFGKLPSYVWKQIFTSLRVFLNTMHENTSLKSDINFDYKKKSIERLEEFSKSNNIDLNHSWKLNNVLVGSITEITNDLDNYLIENKNFSFIHGDLCMSNIMYDFKANAVKVYDPRGVDFNNEVTPYGKSEYDYAKFMHSVFGLYDFIISGFYKLERDGYDLDFHIETLPELVALQNMYKEVFDVKDFTSLYAIMIHLFLSMLPLHSDNEKRQYALLANAFRLYIDLKGMKI